MAVPRMGAVRGAVGAFIATLTRASFLCRPWAQRRHVYKLRRGAGLYVSPAAGTIRGWRRDGPYVRTGRRGERTPSLTPKSSGHQLAGDQNERHSCALGQGPVGCETINSNALRSRLGAGGQERAEAALIEVADWSTATPCSEHSNGQEWGDGRRVVACR
jgi:hypothetical protein